MSKQHTPGPWRWEGSTLRSGATQEMAIVLWFGNSMHDGLGNITWAERLGACGLSTEPSSEANARLIAAAPDLLEALQAILPDAVGNHIGGPDTQARIDAARAAIAKATGSAA